MKLLTHNMLTSKGLKGVSAGYPLQISAKDVRVSNVDFNSEFIRKLLSRINYPVLKAAATELGYGAELPDDINESDVSEDLLQKLHHVLMEVEVVSGELTCPESGRKFSINNGIPNMLMNETEVADAE